MTSIPAHRWQFQSRFRRRAFGWRSQPAIRRVTEAVAEIKKAARKDELLAAEGAVRFLERVSPALEHVDSSSGAIGNAVNGAIAELVRILVKAPADEETRRAWLERLYEAHANDEIPYIETLADHWGELCASKPIASLWADRLLDVTRLALSPDKNIRGIFHGTTACLSALFSAGRYEEILELVETDVIWPFKRWAVGALSALGRRAEALRYAEACRSPWASDWEIDCLCEELLLSSGLRDEAYQRYGLTANRRSTYLAWFRAVAKKYPNKESRTVLADLVRLTPGEEGKWFAAAKDAELYDEAVALANRSPTDPRTLTRAARDYIEKRPAFAVEAGVAALRWLAAGYGYEITGADVLSAHTHTMEAAAKAGTTDATRERIRVLVSNESDLRRFVNKVLGGKLGLFRRAGEVSMGTKVEKVPTPAHPNIDDVLDAFLTAQRKRIAARTFSSYETIVGLLRSYLNGYAYQSLSKAETRLFDRHFNATGKAHREFCQLFGPDKIVETSAAFSGTSWSPKSWRGRD